MMLEETRRSVSTMSLLIVAVVLSVVFGVSVVLSRPNVVYSISIPGATSTPALSYGALPQLSDPVYYASVRQAFLASGASFIDADLTNMHLVVYTNGTPSLEIPIMAKGKTGSWWETPAGVYQVQTREATHFSTIGEVSMPWSMEFQGNFFIHGWPVYADGTPVSSTYSGGCIRLSTDDAKKVYDLARVGMPVIVHYATPEKDSFAYQIKPPSVSASAYLVADMRNGTVLVSRNATRQVPIGSITKLVTALVAAEYINLDAYATVPESAIVETPVPRLSVGQRVRAYDLLFPLLQESSNEAATTLSSMRGTDAFVRYMNGKAQAIGLAYTSFADSSGSDQDVSTPEDVFALLRYILSNRSFVLDITRGTVSRSAYGTVSFSDLQDKNRIDGVSARFVGGAMGTTTSTQGDFAGVFTASIDGQSRDVAVVVLDSSSAADDVRALLDFVATQYAPASQ